MIKKALLTFLLLTGLHAVLVWARPSMGMPTHQWQDNIVKAQTFLYADRADTVMVGTSLSARIIRDSIPSVKSVSFGGCAVEDGLRIISSKDKLPKYVLVEANLMYQTGNSELVSKLTEGAMPMIRKWIPSLREQYEPICLLASLLMSSGSINPQAGAKKVDRKVLEDGIRQYIKEDRVMGTDEAEQRRRTLKALIGQLEAQGVKFVFFEMPVNKRLYHLRMFDQMRQMMSTDFPQDSYCYLPADTSTYLTTDGKHLDFEGQQRFSHYFKQQLSSFPLE